MDFASTLESARNGSKAALGTILCLCRGYIIAVANRKARGELRGRVRPSSLVQETYLRACRGFRRQRFKGGTKGELFAWLRTIVRHQAIDLRRRPAFGALTTPSPPDVASRSPDPSEVAAEQERDRALSAALGRLRARDRQLIEMRHFERLGFREIGARLGCTGEAARKACERAQVELGKELEGFQ